MAMKKSELKLPTLRKEAVLIESLGGEVVVKGLKLSEHMSVHTQPEDQIFAATLAVGVCDADGQRLMSAEDWDVFGGQYPKDALMLYNRISELSGSAPGQAEKNSGASQSAA